MRLPLLVGAILVAALAAAGCGAPEEPPAVEPPHGYVEGAEETAEAQSRLVVADAATGDVRVLDLITEEVVAVAHVAGVTGIATDGRHAYVTAADGAVHVVDSGAWTVDHGDHVHHYRAPIRAVGAVAGVGGPVTVHSDTAVAAVSSADGTVRLLDRTRLDAGAVTETATITGPVAVPYAEHVLVSAGGVEVRTRQGAPVGRIDVPCEGLEGSAVTRRGVVFGCADGALLVTEDDGAFRGEKIPYPSPVDEGNRAREFHHRPGSAALAARAGESGVWSLDVSRRSWTHLPVGPVVAVTTAGDTGPLLTLTADGVLHAHDPGSGRETARAALLTAPVAGDGPTPAIHVDPSRAYVNDPTSGVIHEIDYADNLRVARTFDVGSRASHIVETGR